MGKNKSKAKGGSKGKGGDGDAGRAEDTDPLSLNEKGSFTHAACACGWRGPARRSRGRARSDAQDHRDERCSASGKR